MRDIFDEKWAEVGWVVDVSTGSGRTRVFWETGARGVITAGGFSYGFQIDGCCGFRGFKILNVEGTGRWKFFYDSGSGFQPVGPGEGVQAAFQHGTPMGETGKRGPATEADNDHASLSKKGCDNCNFSPWDVNLYFRDTMPNWTANELAPDHYLVVRE